MNIHIHAFDPSNSLLTKDNLPHLQIHDSKDLDLKKVFIERSKFGVDKLTVEEIEQKIDFDYEDYFIRLINNISKVGSKTFVLLRDAGRLELTTEYIVFHNFRDKLDNLLRRAIAKELASSVSHPHAMWEGKSRSAQV